MAGKKAQSFHEDLRRSHEVKVPTERNFGLTFTVVFAIVAGILAWNENLTWAGIFGAGSALFLLLTFVAPALLRPLNLVWLKFGLLLHRIVNPLVMGFLFFIVITPFGLIMRLAGKENCKQDTEKFIHHFFSLSLSKVSI